MSCVTYILCTFLVFALLCTVMSYMHCHMSVYISKCILFSVPQFYHSNFTYFLAIKVEVGPCSFVNALKEIRVILPVNLCTLTHREDRTVKQRPPNKLETQWSCRFCTSWCKTLWPLTSCSETATEYRLDHVILNPTQCKCANLLPCQQASLIHWRQGPTPQPVPEAQRGQWAAPLLP